MTQSTVDPDSGNSTYGVAMGSGDLQPIVTSPAVIFKYNPHRMPAEDILATFVGRDELLSQLLAHLRDQRGKKRPKHLILYGPRGIGKTTMLLVLRQKIETDPGLHNAFDVLQFSEEERRVANLPSFAVRTLELLSRLREDVKKDIEQARADPKRAMEILLRTAKRIPEKQILLLLDNFDEIVVALMSKKTRQSRDKSPQADKMVRALLESPHFVVVATAIQSPEKRRNFPKNLLEHFEAPIQLKPLPDAMLFLRRRAEQDRREGFLDSLPRFASRIDGLKRLAGGNPRLLVFLYDCLGDRRIPDLVEIVQKTVDDLTPMYQDIIDRLLNRGQAAVLEVLASRGGVGTPEDLAMLTFQGESAVRTFLGDLCDLGLVVRSRHYEQEGAIARKQGREIFRTDPPLFQIWYEMRHLNREESMYLVRFFSLLAGPGEVRELLSELRNGDASVAVSMVTLLEDVADILDHDWSGVRDIFVRDVLRQGGSLNECLHKLDAALTEPESRAARQRVGLLVVRSDVRQRLGDTGGAMGDLDEAEALMQRPSDAETRAKLLAARSRLLLFAGKTGNALAAIESAEGFCDALAGPTAPLIRATVLLTRTSIHYAEGEYQAALEAAQRAKEQMNGEEEPRLTAWAETLCGNVYQSIGEYSRARSCYEKSRGIWKQIGDRSGEATSLGNLGNVCQALGEYKRALEYYEQGLAVKKQTGDRIAEATLLNNLGNVYGSIGKYDRAREYYEEALTIEKQIGDPSGEASSLNNLGIIYRSLGDYQRAQECYEKSLAIDQEIGNLAGEATSLGNLGNVYHSLGEHDRARDHHEKALAMQRQIGNRDGEANALSSLGNVCLSQGDYERAREYYEKALAIQGQIGDRGREAGLLNNLGNVYLYSGDHDRGREFYEKGLAICQQIGDRSGEASSLNNLGHLCHLLGEYQRARSHNDQALAIHQQIGDRSGEASSLNNLGNLHHLQGEHQSALDLHQKALAIRQQIGERSGEATSLFNIGRVYQSLGNYELARDYFEKAHRLFSSLGQKLDVASSAVDIVRSLFALAAAAMRAAEFARAEERIGQAISFVGEAGTDQVLSAFVGDLVIPCLQHSRDLAGRLLPFLDVVASKAGVSPQAGPVKAVDALLRMYRENSFPADMNNLGPTELFLIQSLRDRVERPLHVRALDLMQAGKPAEAAETLLSILDQLPGDIDALLYLSGIRAAENRLQEAEALVRKALAQRDDDLRAVLQLAEIKRRRGNKGDAIRILLQFVQKKPSEEIAYGPLATDLREEGRFEELADIMRRWSDVTGNVQLKEQLRVWIPEADILAGMPDRAITAMPPDDFRPSALPVRLLLGFMRVLLDLYRKDPDSARKHAAETLKAAVHAAPGQATNPLSRDLAKHVREMLADIEWEFLTRFGEALASQADPRDFAREMLDKEQAAEIARYFAEEENSSLKSLKVGSIQGFRDLLRTTSRSIGPATAIRAFGDHFAEFSERIGSLVVGISADAMEHGNPAEVTAALHVVGSNFPRFDPDQRTVCITAMLSVVSRPDVTSLNREQCLQLLNVLYPNLANDERRQVRRRLENLRTTTESRAMVEFFGKTVPAVEKGEDS